jgi:hypothetical protein
VSPQNFLTAKQLNTRLAQRLKQKLQKDADKKYTALESEQEARRKAAKRKGEKPHIDSNELPGGVLAKDTRYAYRGPAYVADHQAQSGGDMRGGVYNQVWNRPHLKEIKKIAKTAVFHDSRYERNFNKKVNQQHPYPWRGHHMLPSSAFYFHGADKKPCFTPEQIDVILRSDYNINDGHNIIMLPAQNWAVPVHELPQHPSNHVRYTQRVMNDLRNISKILTRMKENTACPPELQARVKQNLQNKENRYWEFLVDLGRQAVSHVIQQTSFKNDDGQYLDLVKYKWGRLY